MIEPNFLKYIREILNTETQHDGSNNKDLLFSLDWEFIFDDFEDWVTLDVRTSRTWIHPTLYPVKKVAALKLELPDFRIEPSSGICGEVWSHEDLSIEPEWGEWKDFNESEIQFFFDRKYHGRPKGKENYKELNQIISHLLDLHWSSKKNSFCVMDNTGEEIEKIKFIDHVNHPHSLKLILIRRNTLDRLLHLGNWSLVRYVDFTRRNLEDIKSEFQYNIKEKTVPSSKFDHNYLLSYGDYDIPSPIYFRGGVIDFPKCYRSKVVSPYYIDEEEIDKQYATFIIQNWKKNLNIFDISPSNILEDYSIHPDNLANYFTVSDLPYEISPIFFNAGVLDKYNKGDLEKYELKSRSIRCCKGGWHLKTYAINDYYQDENQDKNQVFTYATYLNKLPYKEQLYWKSFNEKPNAPIPEQTYKTDFKGKFPEKDHKKETLQKKLEELSEIRILDNLPVWKTHGDWDKTMKSLHPVLTENENSWNDFMTALSCAIVDGFKKKSLEAYFEKIGGQYETKTVKCETEIGKKEKKEIEVKIKPRSLGLIQKILEKKDKTLIDKVHTVLKNLRDDRSRGGTVHGSWKRPEVSLIQHAQKTLDNVIDAIDLLIQFFKTEAGPA